MRYTAILSFLLVGLSPLSHAAPSRADARSMNPAGQPVQVEERHLPWMGDDEGDEDGEVPPIGRRLPLLPLLGGDDDDDDNNSTGLRHWPLPGDDDQENSGLLPVKRHWPWMGGDDDETGPGNENGMTPRN